MSHYYLKNGIYFIIGGSLLFFQGFKKLSKKRRTIGVPVSRIRALAVGSAKIQGKIVKANSVGKTAPLSGKRCLFYIDSIEDFYLGKIGFGWRTVKSNSDWVDFYVEDSSGKVPINPEGAEIKLKEVYNFTAFPLKEIPEPVKNLLQKNKIKENMRLVSLPKVFRIKEYVLEEGSHVEIIGYAQPNQEKRHTQTLSQSERLIVKGKEGFEFMIRTSQESIFSDKGMLFSITGGIVLVSVGLGLLARFYSIVNSNFTFALFVLFATFMICVSLFAYYKTR